MLNKYSLSVFAGLIFCAQEAAFAEQLITAEEAALPAASTGLLTRGISRGPGVKLVSPSADLGAVKAPFDLKIAFEPRGGNPIDSASVKVVYMKTPFVDLTPRLQSMITEKGIDFTQADVPAGDHELKVTVTDKDGRETHSVFHLVVTP